MSPGCAALREAIEPIAAGEAATPAQQAHLAECASCQARLALARRLERVFAEWPAPAAAPALASHVLDARRREAWQHEQVVDWSFNIAVAAGLVAVLAGVASMVWLLGAAAGPIASSEMVVGAASALVDRLRGQAMVLATAALLLTTTLGAWWWAEERQQW
jgi:hypothetical protein